MIRNNCLLTNNCSFPTTILTQDESDWTEEHHVLFVIISGTKGTNSSDLHLVHGGHLAGF